MSVGEWREVMAVASRVLRGLRPTRCRSARTQLGRAAAGSNQPRHRIQALQQADTPFDQQPGVHRSWVGRSPRVRRRLHLERLGVAAHGDHPRSASSSAADRSGPGDVCWAIRSVSGQSPCTRWRTSTTSHSRICYVPRLRDILDLGGVDRAPCGKQPTPRGPATSRSTPRVNSGGRLAASPTVGPVAHAGCGGTRPGTVGGRGTAASRETGWRPASTAADAHQRRGLHPLRPGVSPVGPTRLPCCAAVMVPPGPPSPRRRRARASSAARRSRPRGASAHR